MPDASALRKPCSRAIRDQALQTVLIWYATQASRADATVRTNAVAADWIAHRITALTFDGNLDALAWLDREGPNITEAIHYTRDAFPPRCWQVADSLLVWMQRRRPTSGPTSTPSG